MDDTKPFRVHFRHYRYVEGKLTESPQLIRFMRNDLHPQPLTKGGRTVCTIQIGDKAFTGVAECSLDDAFCYGTGRGIAFQRVWAEAVKSGICEEDGRHVD